MTLDAVVLDGELVLMRELSLEQVIAAFQDTTRALIRLQQAEGARAAKIQQLAASAAGAPQA
jgi:hypothetical protein